MTKAAPLSVFRTLDDVDVAGKRVLVRADLNVPMEEGKITDATRIDRILVNIHEISEKKGKVILLSHLGRPKNGPDAKNSLKPVAVEIERKLGRYVAFASDCAGEVAKSAVKAMQKGDVLLLESTNCRPTSAAPCSVSLKCSPPCWRTQSGRSRRSSAAPRSRRNSSFSAISCAGSNMFVGGAMANTFLAASGKEIGNSLCEKAFADVARQIIAEAEGANCKLVLPVDAVVAPRLANIRTKIVDIDSVGEDQMILDVGPRTISLAVGLLASARTLVWNGPVGAFETAPFDTGTMSIAKVAAQLTKVGALETIAGGGDTIAALNCAGVTQDCAYASTAGGAFLEWLEGKQLPGVEALRWTSAPAA